MAVQGRPRSSSQVSIIDVAARAGVSVATVSRALRDLPNVSPATRDRVLRAATELQYTASPLAAGLVTGRMKAVGVVMPYAGRWFFAEVVRGIEEALRDHGYDLVLHVLADAERRQGFFASMPVRRRVDAVLIVALPLEQHEVDVLRSLKIPLAAVAEPVAGVHGEYIDNTKAARIAVQHLVNLGHRRIACIGGDMAGPERFSVPGMRSRGYREACAEAGITVLPEWEQDGKFTAQGGERAMSVLLAQPGGRPTAVFCQSDEMAFGAMHALRRSGLRCPEDVSVIGLDDHDLAETFDVTTIAQPVIEQGAAAARWVVGLLDRVPSAGDVEDEELAASGFEGLDVPGALRVPGPLEGHVHPVRLVLRGSTGPAPA